MARLLACPVAAWVVWVVWIIKPDFILNDEGPEVLPGLFSCAVEHLLQATSMSLIAQWTLRDHRKSVAAADPQRTLRAVN